MFESSILIIVGVVVGIVVALLVVLSLLGKNYIKVSPNQAAVISGRTRKLGDGTVVGYRQVRGGATLSLYVDGTLVDTNYHHAIAWWRAFKQHDILVPIWRIHRTIGMGGDKMIAALCGSAVTRS